LQFIIKEKSITQWQFQRKNVKNSKFLLFQFILKTKCLKGHVSSDNSIFKSELKIKLGIWGSHCHLNQNQGGLWICKGGKT